MCRGAVASARINAMSRSDAAAADQMSPSDAVTDSACASSGVTNVDPCARRRALLTGTPDVVATAEEVIFSAAWSGEVVSSESSPMRKLGW